MSEQEQVLQKGSLEVTQEEAEILRIFLTAATSPDAVQGFVVFMEAVRRIRDPMEMGTDEVADFVQKIIVCHDSFAGRVSLPMTRPRTLLPRIRKEHLEALDAIIYIATPDDQEEPKEITLTRELQKEVQRTFDALNILKCAKV
jgi:hypothetical protein